MRREIEEHAVPAGEEEAKRGRSAMLRHAVGREATIDRDGLR